MRTLLAEARTRIAAGDADAATERIDRALAALRSDRLLTADEAAELLGIASAIMVASWCKDGDLRQADVAAAG